VGQNASFVNPVLGENTNLQNSNIYVTGSLSIESKNMSLSDSQLVISNGTLLSNSQTVLTVQAGTLASLGNFYIQTTNSSLTLTGTLVVSVPNATSGATTYTIPIASSSGNLTVSFDSVQVELPPTAKGSCPPNVATDHSQTQNSYSLILQITPSDSCDKSSSSSLPPWEIGVISAAAVLTVVGVAVGTIKFLQDQKKKRYTKSMNSVKLQQKA